jgi:hypothetical protein
MMTLYFLLLLIPGAQQSTLTARDVVKKSTDQMRGETSQSEMTIQIVRPTWRREMTIRTWLKGENHALILIKSPVKDKGVSFLKRNKEVWNWVPSL